MNSQNILVIVCLFPIFWGLSDVEAKARKNLFNYDDEVDVFQIRDQQELRKQYAAKKMGYHPYHKSLYPVNHHDAPDMFLYPDYDEAVQLDKEMQEMQKQEMHPKYPKYPKPLGMYHHEDRNAGFKMNNEDDTNISIKKWNWMEWILRQQPKRQIHGKSFP